MAEHKRIAFLCHPYHRGGVTRWMADAAIAFAHNGWEVYFITVRPSVVFFSGKGRETLAELIEKGKSGVKILSANVGRAFEFGTQEYRAYIYAQLFKGLPEGTPVILSDDEAVWEAAAMVRDVYPMVGVLHADETYYYSLAEKYINKLSALVCVSERVKRTIIEKLPGADTDIIYTIPCGINLPAANFNRRAGDILQLVYVGRISEYQKRVSDLVKVCALLHQSNRAFHMHIIGDGGEKTELENKLNEAGLGSLVTFHGWLSQKEVGIRLATYDILVLTSDFEGTPIAMMEALAAGCGVVGTRVSGIEDYEQHPLAENCFALFDVGDIAAARLKIGKIAAVAVNTREQAARKLAESEFSMEVCVAKYTGVISAIPAVLHVSIANVKMSRQAIIYSRIIAMSRYLRVKLLKR